MKRLVRKQPNNRIEAKSTKFGIDKDLTTLFFFELKDDIFLTSSTDTDKYKIIGSLYIYIFYI
jgi:hypothetical protein